MPKSNYKYIKQFIRKWEGTSFVNDPLDKGGPTKWGITLKTFKQYYKDATVEDLKNITEEQYDTILRKGYYDKMKADKIDNKSIALLCVDICYGSGSGTAIRKIQRCIGCKAIDGIVGPETLGLLNGPNPEYIFKRLWQMRQVWFQNIVLANPSQKKWINGWMNRLNSIKYEPTSN